MNIKVTLTSTVMTQQASAILPLVAEAPTLSPYSFHSWHSSFERGRKGVNTNVATKVIPNNSKQ